MTVFAASRSLPLRNVVSALVLFAPLFIGRTALAQEACGETTCPKGFTCEVEPGACPAIDCAPGAECQPCMPQTSMVCRPGPCSADADCADGMACADMQQTECDDVGVTPACADAECREEAAKGECTTTTIKQCLPRWALPCAVAADCGDGFDCKEQQSCSCSGSSGSGSSGSPTPETRPSPPAGTGGASSSDPAAPAPKPAPSGGGAEPAPMPEDCSCEPSGQLACEAIQVACTTDADCLNGWSCRDNPESSCWADSNGNRGCTPADPAKLCLPPYVDLGGSGRGVSTDEGTSAPPTTPDTTANGAGESSSASGGGCTIGNAATPGRDALAFGLALAAALGLGRRARRRAP